MITATMTIMMRNTTKSTMSTKQTNQSQVAPRRPGGRKIKHRWSIIAMLILAAGFTANHMEHRSRLRAMQEESQGSRVIVRADDSSTHRSISIDESLLDDSGGRTFLRFSSLGLWDYDPDQPTSCPEALVSMSGETVECIGFMYPLEEGDEISLFCLLKSTQTCCYGDRPKYNQYLFVEMDKPVPFERLRPVAISGRFFADPQPRDGYIYRMEATSLRVIGDDVADVDAAVAAEAAGLALLDLSDLESMRPAAGQDEPGPMPASLTDLDGKTVVVEGFLVGSGGDAAGPITVGKYWWDGVAQGQMPGRYNAIQVFPADERQVPPAWRQDVVFTGRLEITRDSAQYRQRGLISVVEAVRGVPGQGGLAALVDSGPIVATKYEALSVFVLGVAWFLMTRDPARIGSGDEGDIS